MTLNLLATTPSPAAPCLLAGDWRLAQAPEDEGGAQSAARSEDPGLANGYAFPGFDDSSWEAVRLPHLRHATLGSDTLWYRHHFKADPPLPGQRLLLRLGGAFYQTRVWLNGIELGEHEGYFQPFGFDITEVINLGDNVLAVRCRFPVEAGAFKRKTAIAGIFADWDCKPYPSAYFPNLPAPNEWTVPVGLWQPADLLTSGPVLVESFNVFANLHNPVWPTIRPMPDRAESADLRLSLRLRNLTSVPESARITVSVEPANFDGPPVARGEWQLALEPGAAQAVAYQLTLSNPRLWLPWTHGEPWLYRARLRVDAQAGSAEVRASEAVQSFGVREVRAEIAPGRWDWWLNGRRVFPKGSNYVSDFYLDRVTPEGLGRDLALARGANLDLLRVHAHIAPPDFYRLCDEQGLMVMSDFPLIWTYGYGLPPADEAAFRSTVFEQAEAMVHLLGSRPSIVLWSLHNEPPWTPDGAFLGHEIQQAGTNRDMDQAAAARVRELDPSRPAIPASGELDQHLYHGWYTGAWLDNRDLHPSFPTEFGVQALPNRESPVWATVNTNWPVDADDPSWAHAGYQSIFWASPGVGLPAQYPSLADYIAESQQYQAFFVRYTIDQWRRQKFSPAGGYIHFLFTDGWPAITWSVLDYYRLPKAGYQALAEASRPVRLCLDLDPQGGLSSARGFHLVWPEDGQLRLGLHLVNDDYRLSGPVTVRWWLQARRDPGLRGLLRVLGRILPAGHLAVDLPRADEGARLVQSIQLPAPRTGAYRFRVQVRQGRRALDENGFDFRVGAEPARPHPVRRVPGLLVNRVYQAGSLRHTAEGFTFGLRNPTTPVSLQRLSDLKVDDQPVEPAQVDLVLGAVTRKASTITPQAPFDFPSGERLTIVVHGLVLPPGAHELDITIQILGLGEISVRLRDHLV
jgi:beta-mannosidase